MIANMVAGQLQNGGSIGINVRAVRQAIQVGVPAIGNPAGAFGTMKALIEGLQNAATQQGATTLVIRAANVSDGLAKALVRQGFQQVRYTSDTC